ncbi:MAG: UDP-N-acetylmuramoyl-tripeptide--D-alanyl-D-alanine ligase [bacterium]
MRISLDQTANVINAAIKGRVCNITRVCSYAAEIDTRQLGSGGIFFALKGTKNDGHDFLEQAVKKRAAACVVSRKWAEKHKLDSNMCYLCVNSPKRALWQLALFNRKLIKAKVIGVTGSNGKTTTKEIIGGILGKGPGVLISRGNFNNHLGVPLSLIRANTRHEYAVFEMGANHIGEISRLSKLVRPDIGIITCTGESHLKYFKSIKNVAKAKLEIIHGMGPGSVLVVNGDDKNLMQAVKKCRISTVTFGTNKAADDRFDDIRTDLNGVSLKMYGLRFGLNITGRHNAYNGAAAICGARLLGLKLKDIKNRIGNIKPAAGRMEIIKKHGITIINDRYNANPASMQAALETLIDLKLDGRRIGVLGDMLELGSKAREIHEKIGRLHTRGLDRLFVFGNHAREIWRGALRSGFSKIYGAHFNNVHVLIFRLGCTVQSGDIVLVKGSRGMRMELIVNGFLDLIKVKRNK